MREHFWDQYGVLWITNNKVKEIFFLNGGFRGGIHTEGQRDSAGGLRLLHFVNSTA